MKARWFPRAMTRAELSAIDGSCSDCGRHHALVWPAERSPRFARAAARPALRTSAERAIGGETYAEGRDEREALRRVGK
jgi:hypothetical protein